MSTNTVSPWVWDLRVRERNTRQGTVTDKDTEKFLKELPDLAEQLEVSTVPSPMGIRREGE